jgi:hypothetical protein
MRAGVVAGLWRLGLLEGGSSTIDGELARFFPFLSRLDDF